MRNATKQDDTGHNVTGGPVACLLITNLPVKAERSRYPALRRRPLIVVERRMGRDVVLDYSPEARGISGGMPLHEAIRVCRRAAVLQADSAQYDESEQRIADAIEARLGSVERGTMGCYYAPLPARDLNAGRHLFGEAQLISSLLQGPLANFAPRVGVGPGRFIAYALAATAADGSAEKAPRDTAAFLSRCPVDILPIPFREHAFLHRAGIHRLGVLASMPLPALRPILGPNAGIAWSLSRGLEADWSFGIELAAA